MMTKAQTCSENLGFSRSFRSLTREEIADPDKLNAFETMGLGGEIGWDNLLDAKRVLIVSAAGAGKTHECREQVRRLFAAGKAAFFLTLEGISANELHFLLEPAHLTRYRQWLANGYSEAHFFLDSADELLLSHGDFRQALRKLAFAIEGQLHRARIVVTSRPIGLDLDAFASELPVVPPTPEPEVIDSPTESFRRLISGETRKEHNEASKKPKDHDPETGVRIVGLTSLSRAQIEQLAASRGVQNLADLVMEIDRKRAWEFARRPQELIEICSYWNEHGQLGTRSQQIAEDIRRKLQETGERRRHVRLSDAKALEGAERLALAQVLTRKRTIRFSDLSLDAVEQEAAIDPSIILSDWTESERSELLQRPLFGFASYGRVRFHHRSASEFLAAQRLNWLCHDKYMARSALFRLLFGECYGQQLVFPSMRAVAAWLAIGNDAVRDEVLRREPEALMDDGDPESFPISTRSCILAEYVRRYSRDEWRGVRIPYPQVLRFASPDLSPTVCMLWSEGNTNPDVRELLIDLVLAGRMQDCLGIASEVANNPNATQSDRVTALTALAEMTEPRGLDTLITSLLTEVHWPSRVKEAVLDALFPKHMTIVQFVEFLGQIDVKKHNVGGIEWTLPRLIPALNLSETQIADFRTSLTRMIEASIEPDDNWPHFASKFRHLSSALAALCLRQFDDTRPPPIGLVEAAVIATRLHNNEFGDEKPAANLLDRFRQAPRNWRKAAYIAEGHFCATYVLSRNDDESGMNLAYDTTVAELGHDDFDWLLEISTDPSIEQRIRASAFRDALYMIRRDGVPIEERAKAMRDAASGEPAWLDKLDQWLAPAKPDKSHEAREAEWRKEAAARKAKKEAAIDSWVTWRDEILRDPDTYFTKTSVSRVVWDFAQVLERDPQELGWHTHWNCATIAANFTNQIAERVRKVFCAYWRTIELPLGSERSEEERNIIWSNWIHALAGVYAEAEESGWAGCLDRSAAERAARLATVELNGVPPWIKDLIERQPAAVEATLGKELSAQLDDAVSFGFPALLSDFSRADQSVLEFFAPRVWDWLSVTPAAFDGEQEQARMHDHLERAIDFVLCSSIDRSKLIALAQKRLYVGLGDPFALLWLTLLLSTAPQLAIEIFDRQIGTLDPPTRHRLSESLFSTFGDRRSARFCPDLSSSKFTPEILLTLVRLAYAEIRLADDIDRAGGGVYSPTDRDKAQDGREAVLSALLARTGADAWAIKQAMRADPLFAHFKDRLDQLARQKAASEAEGPAHADADVAQVESHGEPPPADRNGMFQLMMARIVDLQRDIAAHEFSERPVLAGIDKEKNMQVWFARRLQDRENGVYRVDREAVVVNDKETDIRLLSVRSNAQAVIEMKLANNGYTVADLEKALEEQVVGQYMQHDNCRAGCLLVTMNKSRYWQCPESGVLLDFEAVLSRLRKQAIALEVRMSYEIRLAIIGIDLTTATL